MVLVDKLVSVDVSIEIHNMYVDGRYTTTTQCVISSPGNGENQVFVNRLIANKFCTREYIHDPYLNTKFGANLSMAGLGGNTGQTD